jgi:hypothetical protein
MGTVETSQQQQQQPKADAHVGALDDDGAGRLNPRATRIVALAGVASFSLIIAGALVAAPLWNAPGTNASTARLVAYVHENRGRTLASLFVYSLGMGMFLCFAAGLWSWLRRFERQPQPLSSLFALAAVALAVLIFAAFATGGVASYRPQQPQLAALLTDVTFALLALSGIPTAVCLGAYATLVLKRRCLPAWTGWLALVAVDAHVLIAASFLSHGSFLSLEGTVIVAVPATFFAWILAVAAALWSAGSSQRSRALTAVP